MLNDISIPNYDITYNYSSISPQNQNIFQQVLMEFHLTKKIINVLKYVNMLCLISIKRNDISPLDPHALRIVTVSSSK